MAELERSGDPVRLVAERVGVGVSAGYAWAKQIRRSPRGEVGSAAAPAFARLVPEARPAAATPEGAFVAQVGGASIRIEAGFVAELLRGVVAVLGSDSR